MNSRRKFIRNTALTGLSINLGFHGSAKSKADFQKFYQYDAMQAPEDLARNEAYWELVKKLYTIDLDGLINLENGYFSAAPAPIKHALVENSQRINSMNSLYMREKMTEEMDEVKKNLSAFSKLPEENLAICRNTTEALDTVIHGFPWKKGDEVILSHQDYGSMQEAFKMQAERVGIKLVYVQIPLQPKTSQEVISQYTRLFTSKTRMVLLTHLINLNGHVLPAKEIIQEAHRQGIEVMLDAAHSFAHIDVDFSTLDMDYLGTSLHKWLSCPLGLGMIYMKAQHIEKIWPLLGDFSQPRNSIKKFEHWGTRPLAGFLAIPLAIDFHNKLGSAVKFQRLFYLKNYWVQKCASIENFELKGPVEIERSGAIATFGIKGKSPDEVQKMLKEDHSIFTVAIVSKEINGVRVTPGLYTSLEDLDALVKAIATIAAA